MSVAEKKPTQRTLIGARSMAKLTLEIDGETFTFERKAIKSKSMKEMLQEGRTFMGQHIQDEIKGFLDFELFTPVYRKYLRSIDVKYRQTCKGEMYPEDWQKCECVEREVGMPHSDACPKLR